MLDANQELPEFLAWAKISKTTAYQEVAAGRLKFVYVGRKPIVTPENRIAWVRSLPTTRVPKAA